MLLNPETEPEEAPMLLQARELLTQGKAAEAAAAVRHYLYYTPGGAADYELLGVALARAGEVAPAVTALEQAQGLDKNNATVAYNLGHAYRMAGRWPDAIAAYERAVTLRPDYDAAKRALEAARQQAQNAPAPAAHAHPA